MRWVLVALAAACSAGRVEPTRVLRVCADPNNMPLSNQRGEGLENRLAALVAEELGARVEYTWHAQRRGFFRNTLKARRCDVVAGAPEGLEMLATTAPVYRSSYVFVTRPGIAPVASFDDPRLRELRIGVPLLGDDGANPPPVHALARRGIVENVRGYSAYGDYAKESPPLDLMRAVARGEVDVAVAWGPFAGWYARRSWVPLAVTPVDDESMRFAIAMGVRHEDKELLAELDAALERRRADVDRLLDEFAVPRSDRR